MTLTETYIFVSFLIYVFPDRFYSYSSIVLLVIGERGFTHSEALGFGSTSRNKSNPLFLNLLSLIEFGLRHLSNITTANRGPFFRGGAVVIFQRFN